MLFSLMIFASLKLQGQCNIIYVSPAGSGTGTSLDPADLEAAVLSANYGDIIRADIGMYTISNPINIPAGVIFEGGFDQANSWRKTSMPGATTIIRDSNNPEGAVGEERLVAFYGNAVDAFRFQDIRIQTDNANGNARTTYGIHLTNCSDYVFSRTIVVAGNGSDGPTGTVGADGLDGGNGGNGAAGDDDGQANSGPGGSGGAGGGAGGGTLGSGGPNPPGCCSAGINGSPGGTSTVRRSGGGGGGGASGGEEDRDGGSGGPGGGVITVFGNNGAGGGPGDSDGCGSGDAGGNGGNGLAGSNGTNGADGSLGSFLLGFFIPGCCR